MAGFANRIGIRDNKFVESHLEGQTGEEVSVDYPGSKLGEEAFILERETVIEIFCYDSAKDSVSQIFQPFVVYNVTHLIHIGGRFMDEGYIVEFKFQGTMTGQGFDK